MGHRCAPCPGPSGALPASAILSKTTRPTTTRGSTSRAGWMATSTGLSSGDPGTAWGLNENEASGRERLGHLSAGTGDRESCS